MVNVFISLHQLNQQVYFTEKWPDAVQSISQECFQGSIEAVINCCTSCSKLPNLTTQYTVLVFYIYIFSSPDRMHVSGLFISIVLHVPWAAVLMVQQSTQMAAVAGLLNKFLIFLWVHLNIKLCTLDQSHYLLFHMEYSILQWYCDLSDIVHCRNDT